MANSVDPVYAMYPNNSVIKRLWCNMCCLLIVKSDSGFLSGIDSLSGEATLSELILPSSEKGSTLKRIWKEFSNSFLIE